MYLEEQVGVKRKNENGTVLSSWDCALPVMAVVVAHGTWESQKWHEVKGKVYKGL